VSDHVESGYRLLKDIPLIGGLFGTKTNGREKTELMITITPYVVRNKAEGDRITGMFQESLKDLKSLMQRAPAPRLNAPAAAESAPATN
jgi:general secretion pathway protein D